MTKEKIMEMLRAKLKKYRAIQDDDYSYYTGLIRGIEASLELIGMLGNKNNK